MSGWIKKHRRIMDHWLYEDDRVFSRYEAFDYLLMVANHADKKTLIDGQLMSVERGGLITSIRKLGERWKWSRTKVVQFLDLLEEDGMIFKKSDTKKTVINIVNYSKFQGSEVDEKDTEMTVERRSNDTEVTQKSTNKNVKKEKNVKKDKEYPQNAVVLTHYLIDLMKNNNQNVKIPDDLDKWYDEMDKLDRINKYDYKQIQSVIYWCQHDDFWNGVILSTPKLRQKFDTLVMQMQRKPQVIPGGKQSRQESSFERLKILAKEADEREASGNY